MLGGLGHLLGDGEHVAQVRGAVLLWWRADGDEHDFTTVDGGREVRGEVEPLGPIALDEVCQIRLEKGNLTAPKLLELLLVDVHARDVRSGIGEACAGDQPHVSRTNDSDFHDARSLAPRTVAPQRARRARGARASG